MTDDEREEYVRSLSEQERLWLLILDELTRLHVEVSLLERRLLKVLATLKDTSIIDEGTEAAHEELAVPFFPVGYRGVAHTAKESYHLDRVAAFLYMGEPEKPKRKKRRTRSTRAGTTKKNPPKSG